MMIAFATGFATLVMAQAAAPLPPIDLPESMLNPIGVSTIAARLPVVQANVAQTAEGGWLCALSASTGSVYVDDRLCQSTAVCLIRQSAGVEDYEKCMRDERKDILDDYRDTLEGGGGLFS